MRACSRPSSTGVGSTSRGSSDDRDGDGAGACGGDDGGGGADDGGGGEAAAGCDTPGCNVALEAGLVTVFGDMGVGGSV